jgi:hypothetical protein
VTWSAGLTALALLVAFTAPAFATAPVLDGNIDDVLAQANTYIKSGTGCGIIINDPANDICMADPLIIPCTNPLGTCVASGLYYVNGFDQILAVAAVQGTDAWWGIRVVGQIGDSDGDGTDSKGASCTNPGLHPEDFPGIAGGERYVFRLDTNCDGVTDVSITVSGGAGTHQPNVIITRGDGETPVPGASGTAMYGTTDLEIHTTGLALPLVFSMYTFVRSDFDGLSADATGPALCNGPLVSLAIQKTAQKPTICPGDKDRFTVNVTNTSLVDVVSDVRDVLSQGWTYSDNVSGDFTFAGQKRQVVSFGPLTIPAGQTRTVSFDATSPSDCNGPYKNKAVADGAFSTPCVAGGEPITALTDTATATVTCDTKPCVTNVHCSAPEAACNGDQITLKGFATNCGDRPADLVITLNGHDHILNNVGAGQEAEFDTTFEFSCATSGEPTQWTVSAVAGNSCGAPGSGTCSTNCGVLPCVNLVCAPADTTVSLGDPYSVRATATNCSSSPEDIKITLNGQPFTFQNVASSATVTAAVMENCPQEGTSTYDATATATNTCATSASATCQAKVTCQVGLCCWLTMRAFLNADMKSGSKDNTFGGNVGPSPSGSWEHIQRDGKTEVFGFHSHDAHVITCFNDSNVGPCHASGDANVIDFGGTGTYSIDGGARSGNGTFTAEAQDHGEPAGQSHTGGCETPDYYTITVKDATTAEVVFTAAGFLDGGNLQIHDCKHSAPTSAPRRGGPGTLSTNGLGDDTSTGMSASGPAALVLLYRPTPNPFSNTTSLAYQVSGSASQRVQIGIYNVAGRLIRELVNETKSPGRYETVWNGQDEGRSQVTHGVYFIRAYVGGVRIDAASRILYLR